MDKEYKDTFRKFIQDYDVPDGLSTEDVWDLINDCWSMVRCEMDSGNYTDIRMMYLGVFRPTKYFRDGKHLDSESNEG